MNFQFRQIIRMLLLAAICFTFVLMIDQAWARCIPLSGAQCEGVKLAQLDRGTCDLSGGNFRVANPKQTDLRTARPEGAYLGNANLKGATTTQTRLFDAQLNRATRLDGKVGRTPSISYCN